jgi:hypothetical protein
MIGKDWHAAATGGPGVRGKTRCIRKRSLGCNIIPAQKRFPQKAFAGGVQVVVAHRRVAVSRSSQNGNRLGTAGRSK